MQSITEGQALTKRFAKKIEVNPDTGCWEWTAYRTEHGYGRFAMGGKIHYAHRVSYLLHVGPIPDGLDLDHLCRTRHCVNPQHLEPVTRRENLQRGRSGEYNAAKTHCPQGHPYDGENLYVDRRKKRQCRKCMHRAHAAYRARKALSVNGETE